MSEIMKVWNIPMSETKFEIKSDPGPGRPGKIYQSYYSAQEPGDWHVNEHTAEFINKTCSNCQTSLEEIRRDFPRRNVFVARIKLIFRLHRERWHIDDIADCLHIDREEVEDAIFTCQSAAGVKP